MAIVGAITMALVACGAGPGATKTQDPVGFKNIELKQGSTSELSLVNTFSGSELTYSATSSDTSKVKVVAVDNDKDTLTVEAVSPGTATITVIAKNSQGSATQTFTVTVPRPTTPDPDPVDIPDIPSLEEDATRTIRLGDKFRGTELTYTAESNRTSVATAEVDNDADTLTVTAVGPGIATITVTATAQGSATQTQTFTVIVPEPEVTPPGETPPTTNNPSNCPSPLTIHRLVNDTKKCTLPIGHTMRSTVPPAELEVRESTDSADTDNIWLIIGKKKGTYTVTIFNAGVFAGAITVIVPNIPPKRKSDVENPSAVTTATTLSEAKPAGGTADLDLANYFTDDDDDTWRYRVKEGGKPDWVLINTKDGFIYGIDFVRDSRTSTTDSKLTLEVLKKVKADEPFTISLYAVDDSGGESARSVTLKFGPDPGGSSPLSPRKVPTYKATQLDNGDLRARNRDLVETALKVGPRRGEEVEHTLMFEDPDIPGFAFANSAYADLEEKDFVPTRGTPTLYCKRGNDYFVHDCTGIDQELPSSTGNDYFVLESSGAVEAKWNASALDSNPVVKFTLKERGNSGTITIRYFVVPAKTADETVASSSAAGSARPYNRSLRVNVVTCSSPPDPINDCP